MIAQEIELIYYHRLALCFSYFALLGSHFKMETIYLKYSNKLFKNVTCFLNYGCFLSIIAKVFVFILLHVLENSNTISATSLTENTTFSLNSEFKPIYVNVLVLGVYETPAVCLKVVKITCSKVIKWNLGDLCHE